MRTAYRIRKIVEQLESVCHSDDANDEAENEKLLDGIEDMIQNLIRRRS